jgi:hypothetical protein
MKFLAKIVSYLFHPLLFPTYGTLLILLLNPNMFGYFGEKVHVVWLILVFALTFVFPAVWLLMMKRLEMIDSLKLETTKERIVPFIATATFYLWTTWMFKASVHTNIPPNQLVFYMMLGATLSIFIAFFINIFAKVSLHTIGAGSLLGLLLILVRFSTYDIRMIFIGGVVLAGIIGTARLILNAHTEREIFTGYFIGFSGQFIAFSIVSRFLY